MPPGENTRPVQCRNGAYTTDLVLVPRSGGETTSLPGRYQTKITTGGRRKQTLIRLKWGIHLTQVATRCCGRAKASTKKRIPRLLLWRGVGLRSASDSRSCRPKAATAMNSRVGRLGGHSHDSRNLTFLFRSREATTHRVYLNEVDTPLRLILRKLFADLCGFAQIHFPPPSGASPRR